MINSILLIDDEDLFHLVFEDACSILDITLSLEALDSSDEADKKFKEWFPDDPKTLISITIGLNLRTNMAAVESVRHIFYLTISINL